MKPPTQARVVIVGGGIAGVSTPYHLTRLGVRDVVLLEPGTLNCGTTWHAAGLVGQTRYGIEFAFISPAEAARRAPILRTDDLAGAVWIPGDGRAIPPTSPSRSRAARATAGRRSPRASASPASTSPPDVPRVSAGAAPTTQERSAARRSSAARDNGPASSASPDGNFILGEAPEVAGYFVCAGFNSAGIANSGGAGKLVAEYEGADFGLRDAGYYTIDALHVERGRRAPTMEPGDRSTGRSAVLPAPEPAVRSTVDPSSPPWCA